MILVAGMVSGLRQRTGGAGPSMGLGSLATFSLARASAREQRQLVDAGVGPIAQRDKLAAR